MPLAIKYDVWTTSMLFRVMWYLGSGNYVSETYHDVASKELATKLVLMRGILERIEEWGIAVSEAYAKGFSAGYGTGVWLDCPYMGALRAEWLNGFDAVRNKRAGES
jgi:ribosome modulation factor